MHGAYLEAMLAGDVAAARRILDRAMEEGADVRGLYLDVLQPALYEVGARWSRAELSVAQEHLVTAATRSLMAALSSRLGTAEKRRGSVLVACVDEELHELGARMVADFLEADGWEVIFLGAVTPADAIAGIAESHAVDVVALSAALPERLDQVAQTCALLAALDCAPLVVVGGQAFGGSRDRALATGAAAYADDALDAVRVIGDRAG